MKLLLKINLFILIVLLITGCSNIIEDPNISVEDTSTSGFIGLSTQCVSDLPLIIYYQPTNYSLQDLISISETQIDVSCVNSSPQYYLLKLPAGEYEITNFGTVSTITEQFKNIRFRVLPHKVTYIGRFNLDFVPNKSILFFKNHFGLIKYGISDNANEDIPYFLQKYKNIPKDKYTIQVVRLQN